MQINYGTESITLDGGSQSMMINFLEECASSVGADVKFKPVACCPNSEWVNFDVTNSWVQCKINDVLKPVRPITEIMFSMNVIHEDDGEAWLAVGAVIIGQDGSITPERKKALKVVESTDYFKPFIKQVSAMRPEELIVHQHEKYLEGRQQDIDVFMTQHGAEHIIKAFNKKILVSSDISLESDLGLMDTPKGRMMSSLFDCYLRAMGYDVKHSMSSNHCNERMFVNPTFDVAERDAEYRRARKLLGI